VEGSQHLTFIDLIVHNYNINIVLTDLSISCDFFGSNIIGDPTTCGPPQQNIRGRSYLLANEDHNMLTAMYCESNKH